MEEVKPVPKVQLIYAFNGTGKTRLSREFKKLIVDSEGAAPTREKFYITTHLQKIFLLG